MIFFIIFLIFDFIFNKPIEITNSASSIYIPKGESEFFYQYSDPILQEGKQAHFFFNYISYNKPEIKILDEDGNLFTVKFQYFDYAYFNITNYKKQKYIFKINSSQETELLFLDNSREINANLDDLFNLVYTTELMDNPPLPLVFVIIAKKEKFLSVKSNGNIYSGEKIFNGDSELEFCEVNGNDCYFKNINIDDYISFDKDKKYKIKINCYQYREQQYLFRRNIKVSIFKEIEFGPSLISYYSDKITYFIIKNYEKFQFSLKSKTGAINIYKYSYINEIDKQNLPQTIDKLEFYRKELKEQNEMSNNGYDYFIIQIDSDYSISKGYLCIYTDSYLINNNKEIEIEKGKYSLLYVNFESPLKHYILASSNKNAILLDDYLFESKNLTNLIIYYNDDIGYYYNHEYMFAYVDSSYEKTTLKFYSYMHYNTLVSKFNLKLLLNTDLYSFFTKNNVDSIFIRNISNNMHFGYNSIYFFDINENYYLYIKKYYGNIDFYQYNQELNSLTEISKLNIPIESYEDSNLYKLINNELIIISGYQLISFFTTYNTLFDIYFQKVDDFENIEINPQIFKYNNLVKLLKENKKYNLNFKVDHLIKLDDGFLNAVVKFSDNNGNQYILDNLHKVINIKGEKIKVISTNNNALLYFYQRIEDESSIKVIEFDKNQKGKNMKFVIENLYSN